MEIPRAYTLMLAICGGGILIDALERITSARKYREGGLYSWTLMRQRFAGLPAWARATTDLLCRGSAPIIVVLVLRIAALALVVTNQPGSPLFAAGLTTVVVTHLYLGVRTAGFGTSGSDPMTLVICGAAWLGLVVADSAVAAVAGLYFIVAQTCLAYVIAGVAKLKAPQWRSGTAMPAVMSTHTYGSATLFAFLRARPNLSRAICWGTMLWEITFPVVLLVPRQFVWPLLAIGFLFHASLAAVMGLNLFLFAYPATYVAIWMVRAQ